MLAFALGASAGVSGPPCRVYFQTTDGRRDLIHETPRIAGASWQDVKIDLGSLPHQEGRLVFEVGEARSDDSVQFHLAEPVLFESDAAAINLILILVDTLRGDHVGFNGYGRPTTPTMDRLAAEGTVFTRAHSPTSWTRPSTAALMTGFAPEESGVHNLQNRIPENQRTLASVLRNAGYATTAFSRNPNVLPVHGFDRGFERFVDADSKDWGHNTDEHAVIDKAVVELERIRDRPFFLYLHLNQVHAPYAPPAGYREMVAGDAANPEDFYDGDIRYTDEGIGRLWEHIRSWGLDSRTLFAVVADHGEEFGEHGGGSHGLTLYEEVLRIPMFIRGPGKVPAGLRIDRAVRLTALADTLLHLLGQGPQLTTQRILLEETQGAERADPDLFFYSVEDEARRLYAASDGRWKYINWMRPNAHEALYDLERDPGEHHDVISEAPAQAERMAIILRRHVGRYRPGLHIRTASFTSCTVEIRLRTQGRIAAVWQDGFEKTDGFRVAPDEKSLVLHSTLQAIEGFTAGAPQPGDLQPPAIRVRYPDVDEIGVVLEPPDSPVEVEVAWDNTCSATGDVWFGGQRAAPPSQFAGNDPALSVRSIPVDDALEERPAAWFYRFGGDTNEAIPAAPKDAVEESVPEDVRERLRALGYNS